MRRTVTLVCLILGLALFVTPGTDASAATPQSGLQITPLRDFQTVKPGQQKTATLTVTNLSSQPETVTMSIKTFSVADYTYDYHFSAPKSDWIHFSQDSIKLDAGDSQKITYYIAPDANASPGGYYYTLVASTIIGSSTGSASTVQAAMLLYLTVDGKLVRTGELDNAHVQRLVFGNDIDYSVDAHNSGNVHYFINTSSKLYGIFASTDTAPTSHLLLPDTVKRIDGAIKSPFLPGLYRVAVTFQTDGGINYTTSRYLVYCPPWTFALILGAYLVFRGLRRPKPHKTTPKSRKTPVERKED